MRIGVLIRAFSVMGPAGAGKSTVRSPFSERALLSTDCLQFVNHATGQGDQGVGHDLSSQTLKIRAFRYMHPEDKFPVVLVDTPSFDEMDTQILGQIAEWFKKV